MMARRLLTFAFVLLGLVSTLEAQGARRTPGLWGMLSGSAGTSTLSCDACGDSEGEFGYSPGATLGLTLSRSFSLELDLAGSARSDDFARHRFGYLTAGVLYFPLTQPLSIEAGVGLGRWQADVPRSEGTERDRVHTTGLAWGVGIGYDVNISTPLALVTRVRMLNGASTELEFGSFPSSYEATHRTLQLSVGLAWNVTANPFGLRPSN